MASKLKVKKVAPGALLGIGNPLLDISAQVDQEFYDKYQLKAASACLAEEKHNGIYADLAGRADVEYIAGGATQNSCRIAQTLLGAANKGACRFIGGVGHDAYSEKLTEACRAAGMEPFYHVDPETPTGTCAVAILDNERSLCANLAAANTFKKAHMDKEEIVKVVEEAQFYYISSFFLTVPEGPDALLQVAKHVQQAGENDQKKVFMMNLAAEFLMQFFQAQFQVALQYCDVVFGNESEAAAYAKAVELDSTDCVEIAQAIASAPKVTPGPRMVIITQGSAQTIVVQNGEARVFPVPKLAKSKIVDTNGAGDAFVGGFLAHYIRGAPIAIAVQSGHAAARNCIQQSGAVLGEPEESVFDQVLIQAAHDGVEVDEISVAFTLGFHAGTAKKLESGAAKAQNE